MILGRSILSVNFFFFFLRAREIISTKFSPIFLRFLVNFLYMYIYK